MSLNNRVKNRGLFPVMVHTHTTSILLVVIHFMQLRLTILEHLFREHSLLLLRYLYLLKISFYRLKQLSLSLLVSLLWSFSFITFLDLFGFGFFFERQSNMGFLRVLLEELLYQPVISVVQACKIQIFRKVTNDSKMEGITVLTILLVVQWFNSIQRLFDNFWETTSQPLL